MTENSILRESKHIEWSIQNFFQQPTEDAYMLESACSSLSEVQWFLRLFTNGEKKNNASGWIGLYLMRTECATEHQVTCRMGIKKSDGSEFAAKKFEYTFTNSTERYGWGFASFIERSKLKSSKEVVDSNGTLTIFCTFRIMDRPFASLAEEPASRTPSDGTSTLIGDLKNLYISRRHADLTIAVQGKEFRAHRSILSSRSSVFESMFFHDMEEKNCGSVEITDCDPDTFEDFLLFLYTGKLDNVSSNNAVSLYRSADKYDVKELKDECVRCMIYELSDDVFCDFLHLAMMQNEKDLLKAATDYFTNNAKTIIMTTKWQTFLAENPVLGNELFSKLLNSKDSNEK